MSCEVRLLNEEEEGSLGFQNLVLIKNNNLFVDTVVLDVCSQVVVEERLTNLVSEVTSNGHSFHSQSHSSSTLNVTKLEESSAHASVGIEKSYRLYLVK